ncbi:hypothetical protein BJ742DRAFT_867279 [Cladochytrium replicatum]|nr:hypothetical protein BJ742DRAFT_867279 [Cladochytrium replicatum]
MFSAVLAFVAFAAAVSAGGSSQPGNFITGTYNVTWVTFQVPRAAAAQMIPQEYSLLSPASAATHPINIELGREIKAGSLGITFDFQEAKIQVPNVKRIDDDTSFVYKKSIFVDSGFQSFSSNLVYGLNTTTQTFVPANSAAAPNYNYEVTGVISGKFKPATKAGSLDAYTATASSPWFATKDSCARHVYDFTAPVQAPVFLEGTLDILENSPIKGSYSVEAMHASFQFGILYPQSCSNFKGFKP